MAENRKFDAKFALRLPAALHERLAQSAEASTRSINAEIVARLEWSFQDEGEPGWLAKAQSRPSIQNARQIMKLELEVDFLRKRVAKIERQLAPSEVLASAEEAKNRRKPSEGA